jgi:hypothetical protein
VGLDTPYIALKFGGYSWDFMNGVST